MEATTDIEEFVVKITYEEFVKDRKTLNENNSRLCLSLVTQFFYQVILHKLYEIAN